MLLGKILDIITSRRVKQEMAKQGITPVNLACAMIKIVLIAMFFSADITYVVSELQKRRGLMRFAKLGKIPEAAAIYRFLARFSEKQFVDCVLGILSSICVKKGRRRALIVDSTDVPLDLNWFKRKIKRRRRAINGDTIIFDRGYYAYKNYVWGISRLKVIPLIFPNKNGKMGKLMGLLSSPLSIFDRSNLEKEKNFYKGLVKRKLDLVVTLRRNYRKLPEW